LFVVVLFFPRKSNSSRRHFALFLILENISRVFVVGVKLIVLKEEV
jgi:hypothetical protein